MPRDVENCLHGLLYSIAARTVLDRAELSRSTFSICPLPFIIHDRSWYATGSFVVEVFENVNHECQPCRYDVSTHDCVSRIRVVLAMRRCSKKFHFRGGFTIHK